MPLLLSPKVQMKWPAGKFWFSKCWGEDRTVVNVRPDLCILGLGLEQLEKNALPLALSPYSWVDRGQRILIQYTGLLLDG